MGKKKVEVMKAERSRFMEGAKAKGIDPEVAGGIFDNIEKFAGYGFNKSHSAAYALLSYDTAYLKANYKPEFMASYLSSQMKAKKEVLGHYVLEVRRSGIKVLPPDINTSMENFAAVGDVIRFGLGAVSRVGHNTIEMIIAERKKNGEYKSLWDFIRRVDMNLMNKTVFENLIKAGAFDDINGNRAYLLEALAKYLEALQKVTKAKKKTKGIQLSLFDLDDETDEANVPDEPKVPMIEDFDNHTRLNYEKEVTGLYMSGHPYDSYQAQIIPYTNCTIAELADWKAGTTKPCVGGIVTSLTERNTKKGDIMCTFQLEDSEKSIEVVMFPKTYAEMKGVVERGTACVVEGRIDERGQMLPDKIVPVDGLALRGQQYVKITLNVSGNKNMNMKDLARVLGSCKGKARVLVEFRNDVEVMRLCLNEYNVEPEKLSEALSKVFPDVSLEVHAA